MVQSTDHMLMARALQLAQLGAADNEVPVGAILVWQNKIIAKAWNQPIKLSDPSAHAEILVLRKGSKYLRNYRLIDTTLYVTLEPCLMCLGAMIHARIKRLVYGAADPKTGAMALLPLLTNGQYNHKILVTSGILAANCGGVLKDFFQKRRN